MEEATATELAWISQLVDALDRAWEAYHSESSISKLWQVFTPTRSPTKQHNWDSVQVESAESPAHPHAEPAAEPLQENHGALDPRAALAAARAALAAAEAEAEAVDWGRHNVSGPLIRKCVRFALLMRGCWVCLSVVACCLCGCRFVRWGRGSSSALPRRGAEVGCAVAEHGCGSWECVVPAVGRRHAARARVRWQCSDVSEVTVQQPGRTATVCAARRLHRNKHLHCESPVHSTTTKLVGQHSPLV